MSEPAPPPKSDQRIAALTLDERTVLRRNADVEHERRVAIFDLLEENFFRPLSGLSGPFHLHISLAEDRLIFDIETPERQPLDQIVFSLKGFRSIIKDYFLICESYYAAIRRSTPTQIEAIDMGRRGLHNEASEMLRERLAEKVEVDANTARRLFTLICVLHIKG